MSVYSRTAKQWSNKTIRFADLKERLKTTIRTSESAEEYAKFTKAQRDAVKDHGGFVAGVLKGGRRNFAGIAAICTAEPIGIIMAKSRLSGDALQG